MHSSAVIGLTLLSIAGTVLSAPVEALDARAPSVIKDIEKLLEKLGAPQARELTSREPSVIDDIKKLLEKLGAPQARELSKRNPSTIDALKKLLSELEDGTHIVARSASSGSEELPFITSLGPDKLSQLAHEIESIRPSRREDEM